MRKAAKSGNAWKTKLKSLLKDMDSKEERREQKRSHRHKKDSANQRENFDFAVSCCVVRTKCRNAAMKKELATVSKEDLLETQALLAQAGIQVTEIPTVPPTPMTQQTQQQPPWTTAPTNANWNPGQTAQTAESQAQQLVKNGIIKSADQQTKSLVPDGVDQAITSAANQQENKKVKTQADKEAKEAVVAAFQHGENSAAQAALMHEMQARAIAARLRSFNYFKTTNVTLPNGHPGKSKGKHKGKRRPKRRGPDLSKLEAELLRELLAGLAIKRAMKAVQDTIKTASPPMKKKLHLLAEKLGKMMEEIETCVKKAAPKCTKKKKVDHA
jgi:hypothetical protein